MSDKGLCFMCGKGFNKDNQKTDHHSIPISLKPVSNIKIPVHKSCHEKINNSKCYGNEKIIKKCINVLKSALKGLEGKGE